MNFTTYELQVYSYTIKYETLNEFVENCLGDYIKSNNKDGNRQIEQFYFKLNSYSNINKTIIFLFISKLSKKTAIIKPTALNF